MFRKLVNQKEEIHEIVDKLHHYGFLNPVDWNTFHTFKQAVEYELSNREEYYEEELFTEMANETEINKIRECFKELHNIYEEIQYVPYFNARVSIHRMHDKVYFSLWSASKNGETNRFFDFKELVEMINCFYEIEEPYKPSNKIAYGWNFSLQKGSDAFRPYLYGCIRNYLRKNGVEFKTADLQKICYLRELDDKDI